MKHVFKPFAGGGRVVREYDLFDKESIDEWMTFLKLGDEAKDTNKQTDDELKQMLGQGRVPVHALMNIATPAPFGKGSETVFDSNVRKAFEIPADRIPAELFPHDYPEEDKIRDEIESAMKPEGAKWTYKLYKMHLYGPGGKFHPHVDTLHDSNHVATLVVALAVEHEGGSLVIKHLNKSSTYNLSNSNPKEATYCAFFTDCEHEVEEVVSGWRVVTQYNIYEEKTKSSKKTKSLDDLVSMWSWQSGPAQPSSMSYEGDFPQAEKALLEYLAAHDNGDRVAILCHHLYSLPALQAGMLKGADSFLFKMFSSEK